MAVYGFQIQVEGNAIKSIQGVEHELGNLEHKSKETQSKLNEHFGKIGESVKGFGMSMKSLAIGGLGIGALFGGAEFAKASLEAFDKYEEGIAKLEAVIKSTGGVAGRSIEELKDGAKELSGQTLFGKAAIMDAQSMLLTFTSIRGEIFDKTMPAVANFATRFKMEMPEAANMLGKALNDPLKGMTRLQRQGVVFSEQQKETIRQFMATGQVAKAQGVILKELDTEFGGLATAMSKTDAGKLKMASKSLSEMKIGIGELISKGLVKLTPLVEGLGKLFKNTFGHTLSQDLTESKDKMNSLFETLKDGNISLDSRKSIIAEINNEYAPYLKGLLTEKMTTEELSKAQAYSNEQMVKKIEIEIKSESIAKAYEQFKNIERKYIDAKIASNKADIEYEKYKNGLKNEYSGSELLQQRANITLYKEQMDRAKIDYNETMKAIGLGTTGDLRTKSLDQIQSEIQRFLHKGEPKSKITPGGGLSENAFNTSTLPGASGGLGEARVVKIDFHKALMEINMPGGNGMDVVAKAPMTIEMMLRLINNLSQSQGSTM